MKLEEILNEGMKLPEAKDLFKDIANELIEDGEYDAQGKITNVGDDIAADFQRYHQDLEYDYGYDPKTDTFEDDDEEDFVEARNQLVLKLLKKYEL